MRRTRTMWGAGAALALGIGFGSSVVAQDPQPDAPPAQQPAQADPAQADPAQAGAALDVTQIQLGKELENGRPVAEMSSFSRADGRIYCVVHLTNTTGAESSVRVAFERAADGEPIDRAGGVELDVPARPRYRTVARTGTGAPGSYRCVVRDAEGHVLRHAPFQITE